MVRCFDKVDSVGVRRGFVMWLVDVRPFPD